MKFVENCLILLIISFVKSQKCTYFEDYSDHHSGAPGVGEWVLTLGLGIDLAHFDFLKETDRLGSITNKQRILNLNCDLSKLQKTFWETESGKKIQIPDEVDMIQLSPDDTNIEKSIVNEEDYKKYLMDGLNMEVAPFGAFSMSPNYLNRRNSVMTGTKLSLTIIKNIVEYHMTLKNNLSLSDEALMNYSNLPTRYEANSNYDNFIRKYGTHFFKKITFGSVTAVEERKEFEKLNIHSSLRVATIYKFNDDNREVIKITVYGCKVMGCKTGIRWDYNEDEPLEYWPVAGELGSIADLFPDDYKKVEFKKAVDAHLDKKYLDSILSTLNAYEKALHIPGGPLIVSSLKDEAKDLKNQNILDHRRVVEFSNRFDDFRVQSIINIINNVVRS